MVCLIFQLFSGRVLNICRKLLPAVTTSFSSTSLFFIFNIFVLHQFVIFGSCCLFILQEDLHVGASSGQCYLPMGFQKLHWRDNRLTVHPVFVYSIYLGFLSEDIHLSLIQSNSEICLGSGCHGSVDADIDVVLMEGVKSCLVSVLSYFALIFPFSYLCVQSIFRGSSFGGSWLVTMESSGLTVLPHFPLVDKSYIKRVFWCI